ncbi:hypothetical protein IFM46972_03290 [Aspergillus udagawae]|uniref:Uncharacterized protein n=1 Tax=Aspergillus udagawae TaxID=91492 RepID=A0A8H3RNE3_9EURO|nr:hypothetical protein IFM46972_03290 [Aspergillus udagawae]
MPAPRPLHRLLRLPRRQLPLHLAQLIRRPGIGPHAVLLDLQSAPSCPLILRKPNPITEGLIPPLACLLPRKPRPPPQRNSHRHRINDPLLLPVEAHLLEAEQVRDELEVPAHSVHAGECAAQERREDGQPVLVDHGEGVRCEMAEEDGDGGCGGEGVAEG